MTDDDTPVALTPEALREHYHRSLGSFVRVFSLTEGMLRSLLAKVVGVDEPTAMAIFSGTRSDQASSFIRRCYEARGTKIPPDLDKLLSQMALIAAFRNDVIHQDVDFASDPPVITNRRLAISERALRETPINSHTLYHASTDLGRIMLGLSAFIAEKMNPQLEDNLKFALRGPWKHKSPGQANKDQKGPKRVPRPKRTPPPKPSPE